MKRFAPLLAGIALALCLAAQGAAQDKHVMVINSYHADYPWVVEHNSALSQALEGKARLTFHYLDSKRLPTEEATLLADEVLAVFQATRPDIVVLADDFALKELGNKIMAESTPVVFLGINTNPRNYLDSMTLATGVLERPLLKRSIVYIKDILGNTMDHCLVLFDNGTTAEAIVNSVFQGPQVTFAWTVTDIKLHTTLTEWKHSVLTAGTDGYDAIILGLYHTLVDEAGNHVPSDDVARWTAANTPIPVFGFWDFSVASDKAIGGLVLSGRPQGEKAAAIVELILNGRSPHTIQPVTAEHGRFIFSRSGLKRWNIKLPEHFLKANEPVEFVD